MMAVCCKGSGKIDKGSYERARIRCCVLFMTRSRIVYVGEYRDEVLE